jgi:hypothetical protein
LAQLDLKAKVRSVAWAVADGRHTMTAGGITVSAVRSVGSRFGRLERASLALALMWATGLIVAAMLVPVYQSSTVSGSGTMIAGPATLVGVNGWGALLVAGAPLAAAAVTGGALWRRGRLQGAGVLAWVITGLLVCFNLLAMLSIGVFVLPVTLALVVACASHGRKPGVIAGPGVAR